MTNNKPLSTSPRNVARRARTAARRAQYLADDRLGTERAAREYLAKRVRS